MRSPRTATKGSPRLPQLEKARVQQRRPNTAKNKKTKKKKKQTLGLAPDLLDQNLHFNKITSMIKFEKHCFRPADLKGLPLPEENGRLVFRRCPWLKDQILPGLGPSSPSLPLGSSPAPRKLVLL